MTSRGKITTDYDYIFTGCGCAAMSLLMRLTDSGQLTGKTVLVIDKSSKTSNDRTWCFWEKEKGFFESLVYHSWSRLRVYGKGYEATSEIAPYRYKMIRGIDFYNHCRAILAKNPAITMLQADVSSVGDSGGSGFARVGDKTYTATYIFNSILFAQLAAKNNQVLLLQHFKGFVISTGKSRTGGETKNHITGNHPPPPRASDSNAPFDPGTGTLMDFRTSQQHGTTFFYVLPLSATDALVEYTLFTPNLLDQSAYDLALNAYIKEVLKIDSFEVKASEFGVIPMTNIPFSANEGNVINIGTAGGQTKASTGYTFSFIQKQVHQISSRLLAGKFPVAPKSLTARKFDWYDSILLNVLRSGELGGDSVFTELFRKNRMTEVFRFLDNESSLLQDLMIISSLPTGVFARAAFINTKPPGSAVLHS